MKKVIKYIGFICSLLLTAACGVDVPDNLSPGLDPYYLTVDSQNLYFSSEGETKYLNIKSSVDWSFSDYDYWISLSSQSGHGNNMVTVAAEENYSGDASRTNIFYLGASGKGWTHTKPISVQQAAATPYLYTDLNERRLDVSGKAATYRVNVESNTVWSAYVDSDNWCTVTVADDLSYLDVHIAENNTGYARGTSVTLSGAITIVFEVNQQTAQITADNPTLSFPRGGGSYIVNINADAAWTAAAGQTWLDISQTSGKAGNNEIIISATEYWGTSDRTGYIYFYIGASTFGLKVTQSKAYINTLSSITLKALGEESVFVQVNSNFPWEVISAPNWLKAAVGSGAQEGMVMLEAENNSESVNRSGRVTLGKQGLSLTAEILVTQEGKYFSVNNEALAIGSTGGTMQLTINTNDRWKITMKDEVEWLDVSSESGKEKQTVNFIAGDNPSVNTRSTTANIASADLDSIDVVIRQQARYLSVDTYGLTFFSKGEKSRPVVVSTDGVFATECTEDWISISSGIGNQSNVIYVTTTVNDTNKTRRGKIKIYLTDLIDGEMSLTINVEQLKEGGNFFKTDYMEDVDWDKYNYTSLTLSVVGFSGDESWDEPECHGLELTVIGYQEDENWDGNFTSIGLEKDDFNDEEDLDDPEGSGNFGNGGEYGEDESYDSPDVDGDMNVDKEKHPDEDESYDSNWEFDFGKEDFSEDENYDNA
jgi:hypothetical protein